MTTAQAEKLLRKYYPPGGEAYAYLYGHSKAVAEHALDICRKHPDLNADAGLVYTGALLHDIGIFMTHAPAIGCHGGHPYLLHGCLGRELLEKEGWPLHALICERHVGVGISMDDIRKDKLPLPLRDMLPLSIEEEIICFADKFYSKKPGRLTEAEKPEKIIRKLEKYGADKAAVFAGMMKRFA
jgi:uncharacterized protein